MKKVAQCPECPRSSCPSPERYMNAYKTEAEHVYVVTLSANLSGSYNSAVLGKTLYEEAYGEKQIYVIDSCSASWRRDAACVKGNGIRGAGAFV